MCVLPCVHTQTHPPRLCGSSLAGGSDGKIKLFDLRAIVARLPEGGALASLNGAGPSSGARLATQGRGPLDGGRADGPSHIEAEDLLPTCIFSSHKCAINQVQAGHSVKCSSPCQAPLPCFPSAPLPALAQRRQAVHISGPACAHLDFTLKARRVVQLSMGVGRSINKCSCARCRLVAKSNITTFYGRGQVLPAFAVQGARGSDCPALLPPLFFSHARKLLLSYKWELCSSLSALKQLLTDKKPGGSPVPAAPFCQLLEGP